MQGQSDPGTASKRAPDQPQSYEESREERGPKDLNSAAPRTSNQGTEGNPQGQDQPIRNPSGDDLSEAEDGDEGSGRGF